MYAAWVYSHQAHGDKSLHDPLRNLAYNPDRAYNKSYECPLTPSSNRLKVAIRAGEKAPPK